MCLVRKPLKELATFVDADAAYGPVVDQVDLPYGHFQGYTNQTSNLTYFLGISYAAAPVGPLRFNIPHPPPYVSGVRNATSNGAACIQRLPTPSPGTPPLAGTGELSQAPANQSEDCLFVNVIRPSNIPSGTQLPILFWIYGGGFEAGDAAENDGTPMVERSIALGEPIIYVSMNYRLNAYGFLASKEVKAARVGNLGFRTRYALEWVQKNIHLFGGDKEKVTIWGESAGASSVGFHLVANGGNPGGLYRGVFMNSGSPPPSADITAGQSHYDVLVKETGCANASDTLECLRGVPQENLTEFVVTKTPNTLSFQSLQIAYLPRVDGDVFIENPQDSIAKGAYAKVPFVTGDCYDEGTLFSISQKFNTSAELLDYIHRNYFPNASTADIGEIGRLYPDNPMHGSPFGTGNETFIYPQYKQLAAFAGDLMFQSPRRYLLEAAAKTQKVWAFKYRRSDAGAGQAFSAAVGSHHTVDALSFGFAGSIHDTQGIDAVVNFVNHLDPSGACEHQNSSLSSIEWPTWDSNRRSALTFWDPTVHNVTADTEREEAIKGLKALARNFPLGYTDLPVSAT